jgi:glycosyltransferase involved in cell wall biosynthesis
MNIYIITNLSSKTISFNGIQRYAFSLINSLKKNLSTSLSVWYTSEIIQIAIFKNYPVYFPFKKIISDSLIHFTCQTFAIPLLWQRSKANVIITVHDIIPCATKEYSSFADHILNNLAMHGLKKAQFIIADSEQTKKDLINLLHIPENKIHVIYLGIDHSYFYPKKVKKQTNRILYVGSESKRKNLASLFKAIAEVKKIIPSVKLIKIGVSQDKKNHEKLVLLAKKLGIEQNIEWKGYVENLVEEYRKAQVFVFPSIYEGFGFPVLEAMACGCPVICSDKSSLPEIAGDAAIYFDGCNYKDLANNIIKVLSDNKVQKTMMTKGVQQAKKFTWEKCAKETQEVYKKVYNEHHN